MERVELLGAVLVVKDEAAVIAKTLDSLVGHVDHVLVFDTGSTDDTVKIASAYAGRLNVDVHLGEFKDYAQARNDAMKVAGEVHPCVFTLALSADETLIGGPELRAFLGEKIDAPEGAYCIMMQTDNRQWPFPRVLRRDGGWSWKVVAGHRHEQPVSPTGEVGLWVPTAPGVRVLHVESDVARKLKRLREEDVPDLTADVEDEKKAITDRMESILQLAESYFILAYNEPKDENGYREVGGKWVSWAYQAMALYLRFADIAQAVAEHLKSAGNEDHKFVTERAMYALLMHCRVGATFGVYEPTEVIKRLAPVAARTTLPEAHWELAQQSAKVNRGKAIPLALRAAKVAAAALRTPVHGPTDVTLEWKSYLLGADCARSVKDKKLQAEFVKLARRAGAPEEVVGDLA